MLQNEVRIQGTADAAGRESLMREKKQESVEPIIKANPHTGRPEPKAD